MAMRVAIITAALFLAVACVLASAQDDLPVGKTRLIHRRRHGPRPSRRDTRIYTFAYVASVQGDPPHDLIDEQTGELKGLALDVMEKACRMARKTCVTVTSNACWNNEDKSSLGLNSRWYDACGNMYHTADRGRSYAFIGAYAQEPPAFIYAKAGSSINSVSPATQTIGVHRTFWINAQCLKSHNMLFKNVIVKDSFDDIKSALNSGAIDVGFLSEKEAGGNKKLGSVISCASTGPAFMIRKDMVNEMQWFDRAVKRLIRTRDFKRMCQDADNKYGGGDPLCL